MQQSIQQTYRHIVQQHIVRQHIVRQQLVQWEVFPHAESQEIPHEGQAHRQGVAWETGGVLALLAAAAASGVLAQAHLG